MLLDSDIDTLRQVWAEDDHTRQCGARYNSGPCTCGYDARLDIAITKIISAPPHGNARASASGNLDNEANREIGRAPQWLIDKLREYADFRATSDELSLILYRAADELEALTRPLPSEGIGE